MNVLCWNIPNDSTYLPVAAVGEVVGHQLGGGDAADAARRCVRDVDVAWIRYNGYITMDRRYTGKKNTKVQRTDGRYDGLALQQSG